jgi:hypothetical protein
MNTDAVDLSNLIRYSNRKTRVSVLRNFYAVRQKLCKADAFFVVAFTTAGGNLCADL